MAGVLFVIIIPSEDRERSRIINKSIQFRNESQILTDCIKSTKNLNESDEPPQLNIRSKSDDFVTVNVYPRVPQDEIKTQDTRINKSVDSSHFLGLKHLDHLQGAESTTLQKSWEGFKDIMSSGRKKKPEKHPDEQPSDDSAGTLPIKSDSTMETVLTEILKLNKIENATWIKSKNEGSFQIIFSVETGARQDNILQLLSEWGIGDREGSSVSLLPCTVFYKQSPEDKEDATNEEDFDTQKQSAWDRFINSIRARLNVAQIVEEVKQDAAITFDFIILLVVAGILAAFGLVENSTIFLASSMLISPLMGPIIAAIFGSVVKDKNLQMIGVVNELIGIACATLVGFIFGLIVCSLDDKFQLGSGITTEMESRCLTRSLIVGIFTALPSGAAVAIAILGENIGSLVGVAISASLLPPAVNAGIFWALSFLFYFYEQHETKYNSVITTKFYSDHQSVELAVMGAFSMCLTIINIICIYVMGVLVLKMKEVASIFSKNHRQFWKHDIKIARDYNKSCQSEESISLTRKLAGEIADFQNNADSGISAELFRNIGRSSYQNTWSPMSVRHHFNLMDNQVNTIHGLEKIYMSIAQPIPGDTRGRLNRKMSELNPRSIIGKSWSPPKYKTLPDEQYISTITSARRGSVPFMDLPSPQQYFMQAHLEKIMEASLVSEKTNTSQDDKGGGSASGQSDEYVGVGAKRKRKFTVTPAEDPLVKGDK